MTNHPNRKLPPLIVRTWDNRVLARVEHIDDAWALALDRSARTGDAVKIEDRGAIAQTCQMPDGSWVCGKFIEPSEE